MTTLLLFSAACMASGCDWLTTGNVCDAKAYEYPPPVNVAIRDQAGFPAALGAVVIFASGSSITVDSTRSDSLVISGGAYNTKTGVLISKRYYTSEQLDTVVNGRFSRCGVPEQLESPVTLNATLTLIQGSPSVRSLYLLPASYTLDRTASKDSVVLRPHLDADWNVTRAVSWHLSGDTASISFNPATGVAVFRCRSTPGNVTVVATSVADTTLRASATIRVQEHPASSTDPSCS